MRRDRRARGTENLILYDYLPSAPLNGSTMTGRPVVVRAARARHGQCVCLAPHLHDRDGSAAGYSKRGPHLRLVLPVDCHSVMSRGATKIRTKRVPVIAAAPRIDQQWHAAEVDFDAERSGVRVSRLVRRRWASEINHQTIPYPGLEGDDDSRIFEEPHA